MPPVTVMLKPVSGACGMRCRYCFYRDELRERGEEARAPMPLPLLETCVRRVLRAAEGCATFLLQGGEPTLAGLPFFRALVEYERRYNARGLRVFNAVQTGGVALSDELIDFFARERFLVGVSLDGCESVHDALRPDAAGLPTFARVRASLGRLLAAGAEVNVLCVVTRETARRASEVLETLAPYRFLQFIPCLDPLRGGGEDWSLTPEAYLAFLNEAFALYARAFDAGKPVSIRTFDNWVAVLLGAPPENCAMVGRCAANLVVESDGSVYPCDFYALEPWRLGNIAQDSLLGMLAGQKLRDFVAPSIPTPEACQGCRFYPLCRNGCRRERDETTGRTRWCETYKAFFPKALPDLERIAQAVRRRGK